MLFNKCISSVPTNQKMFIIVEIVLLCNELQRNTVYMLLLSIVLYAICVEGQLDETNYWFYINARIVFVTGGVL